MSPSVGKAQWQALIDEFEQSGLSRKAFCEAQGINPDYFTASPSVAAGRYVHFAQVATQ